MLLASRLHRASGLLLVRALPSTLLPAVYIHVLLGAWPVLPLGMPDPVVRLTSAHAMALTCNGPRPNQDLKRAPTPCRCWRCSTAPPSLRLPRRPPSCGPPSFGLQ